MYHYSLFILKCILQKLKWLLSYLKICMLFTNELADIQWEDFFFLIETFHNSTFRSRCATLMRWNDLIGSYLIRIFSSWERVPKMTDAGVTARGPVQSFLGLFIIKRRFLGSGILGFCVKKRSSVYSARESINSLNTGTLLSWLPSLLTGGDESRFPSEF